MEKLMNALKKLGMMVGVIGFMAVGVVYGRPSDDPYDDLVKKAGLVYFRMPPAIMSYCDERVHETTNDAGEVWKVEWEEKKKVAQVAVKLSYMNSKVKLGDGTCYKPRSFEREGFRFVGLNINQEAKIKVKIGNKYCDKTDMITLNKVGTSIITLGDGFGHEYDITLEVALKEEAGLLIKPTDLVKVWYVSIKDVEVAGIKKADVEEFLEKVEKNEIEGLKDVDLGSFTRSESKEEEAVKVDVEHNDTDVNETAINGTGTNGTDALGNCTTMCMIEDHYFDNMTKDEEKEITIVSESGELGVKAVQSGDLGNIVLETVETVSEDLSALEEGVKEAGVVLEAPLMDEWSADPIKLEAMEASSATVETEVESISEDLSASEEEAVGSTEAKNTELDGSARPEDFEDAAKFGGSESGSSEGMEEAERLAKEAEVARKLAEEEAAKIAAQEEVERLAREAMEAEEARRVEEERLNREAEEAARNAAEIERIRKEAEAAEAARQAADLERKVRAFEKFKKYGHNFM